MPVSISPQLSGEIVANHGFGCRLDQKKFDCEIIIFNPNNLGLNFDNNILGLELDYQQYLFIGFRRAGSPFQGTPLGGDIFQQRFSFIIGSPVGNRFFAAPEAEGRTLRLLFVLIVLQELILL